jgi:hypothetical protein
MFQAVLFCCAESLKKCVKKRAKQIKKRSVRVSKDAIFYDKVYLKIGINNMKFAVSFVLLMNIMFVGLSLPVCKHFANAFTRFEISIKLLVFDILFIFFATFHKL